MGQEARGHEAKSGDPSMEKAQTLTKRERCCGESVVPDLQDFQTTPRDPRATRCPTCERRCSRSNVQARKCSLHGESATNEAQERKIAAFR